MSDLISHGRGGAANFRKDDTVYADGGIIREGPVGDQGDGNYSAGRGGAGNIEQVDHLQTGPGAGDEEIVPDTATRLVKEESQHYGRGGAGNETHFHKNKTEQHGFSKKEEGHHESLVDKVKEVFHKH